MSEDNLKNKRSTSEDPVKMDAKKPKISISLGSKPVVPAKTSFSISMGAKKPVVSLSLSKPAAPTSVPVSAAASLLDEDDEDEEEEMPPEARMRMRNVGKQTPTSAGPNSFSKGSTGFSDNSKRWEKSVEKLAGASGLDYLAKKQPEVNKVMIDQLKRKMDRKDE